MSETLSASPLYDIIEKIKKVVRYAIFPVYILAYFMGWIGFGASQFLINVIVIYIGTLAFLRRKIPWYNYLIGIGFSAFYYILFATTLFDSAARLIGLQDRWSFYGLIYTILVISFGIRFMRKKKGDKYQILRTISVMAVQLVLAFIIPMVLRAMIGKEYYFSYLWPLQINYFYPQEILGFPAPLVFYSVIGSLVVVPILALLVGKRFYCSWICGCGGLAETLGDPWRDLSDKSEAAWKFEKISIQSILVFAVITTTIIVLDYFFQLGRGFHDVAEKLKSFYDFIIKTSFAGLLGVTAYPILGSRVWCRFFCPMASMIGLIQKGGRYHIHVKKNMCISCGNCSTYCEMGIDVKAYAQTNKSFTRASCVGCGLCANVCPRGVLRLENKKTQDTVI